MHVIHRGLEGHVLDSWSPAITLPESLKVIIIRSMGKAVTFHTPHTPSSCSRRTNCSTTSENFAPWAWHETQPAEWQASPGYPLSYQTVCVCVFTKLYVCACMYKCVNINPHCCMQLLILKLSAQKSMFLNQFSYPSQTAGVALEGERDTVLHNTQENNSRQWKILITCA